MEQVVTGFDSIDCFGVGLSHLVSGVSKIRCDELHTKK